MSAARAHGHGGSALLYASLAMAVLLALGPATIQAATVSGAWTAKIGSAGANGSSTIQAFTSGTGTLALKVAKMRASTTLPVVLHKGTCSSVGAVLLTLPSIKTTGSGTASRTSTLTSAQVTKILAATAAGKIAIRVGTGGARRCGLFAAMAIPAYVATTIKVGDGPSGVAIAPSGVWVTNYLDGSLSRIDPATNSVLQTFEVGSYTVAGTVVEFKAPEAIAYGEGSLWVTLVGMRVDISVTPVAPEYLAGAVLRIDPTTGGVLATIPVGKVPLDIDVTTGAIWVAAVEDGSVARIDPATNSVAASVLVPNPTGVAAGAGAVWVVCACGTVSRIDPATNSIVTTISTQRTGFGIATGAGAVWVAHPGQEDQADGSVTKIDPATNAVLANVTVGEEAQSIAVAGGSVWVGLNGAPSVVQVSPATNKIGRKLAVPASVYAIAATDHAVWAVHEATDQVTRINY